MKFRVAAKRIILPLLAVALMLGSCVPNRKLVYLQNDDVKKRDLPVDTIVRKHDLKIAEYTIQPLDLLYIRIESLTAEDYDFISKLYPLSQSGTASATGNQSINGFLVDNKGFIEFPAVGKVEFGGLTVFEAEQRLQTVFAPFLKNPVVRVRLLNFRFTVLGEVTQEGQIISQNTRVTILEAIGMSGGLTDMADRSKVKIVRQAGSESQIFYVNLLDENMLAYENLYVKQNDLIVVPALRQRPYQTYFSSNLGIFLSLASVLLLIGNIVLTLGPGNNP